MKQPVLYERYSRDSAIALFGPLQEARELAGGEWVLFPHVALCFTDLGGSTSELSCFETASKFWWASKLSTDRDRTGIRMAPEEVRGGYKPALQIWLFGRWAAHEDYACLGTLAPSHCAMAPYSGTARVEFPLTPAIPWRFLADINGVDPEVRDFRPVAAALERLGGAATAHERFEVLQALVEYWRGPVGQADGYSEEELTGIAMPDVLRWWYRWAGKRTEIMSGQNWFKAPGELEVLDDNLLYFYMENQGCNFWAAPIQGEDPTVSMTEDHYRASWDTELVRVSEHLIIACLLEAVIACPYGAMASTLPVEVFNQITKVIKPVSVPPWLWFSTEVYCSDGVAMSAMGDGAYRTVWIGALTEEPVQFLKEFVNDDWEYLSI